MKNTHNQTQLVSIIMPVYNAGQFLHEAIASILWQTYGNWELIAVDDGSIDNSWKILQAYAKKDKRIKPIHMKQNKGLAYALNIGLDRANGYYIARMDSDDVSLPKRLETQIKYLKNNPNIIAAGTQAELINENGDRIGYKTFPTDAKTLHDMMMTMMPIQHPTLLTYGHIMKKYKYENHSTAEDVSMFFKLLQEGDFGNTSQILFQYRIRPNSNSMKNPKKTFFLTFKSRMKAIVRWGYKPTIYGLFANFIQFAAISLLPTQIILSVYELVRFKNLPIFKIQTNKLTTST